MGRAKAGSKAPASAPAAKRYVRAKNGRNEPNDNKRFRAQASREEIILTARSLGCSSASGGIRLQRNHNYIERRFKA